MGIFRHDRLTPVVMALTGKTAVNCYGAMAGRWPAGPRDGLSCCSLMMPTCWMAGRPPFRARRTRWRPARALLNRSFLAHCNRLVLLAGLFAAAGARSAPLARQAAGSDGGTAFTSTVGHTRRGQVSVVTTDLQGGTTCVATAGMAGGHPCNQAGFVDIDRPPRCRERRVATEAARNHSSRMRPVRGPDRLHCDRVPGDTRVTLRGEEYRHAR